MSEVTELLYNNNMNIISFQVNICDNEGESYQKFKRDSRTYIREVAKNIVSDKVKLKPQLKKIGGYAFKLDLSEEGRRDYNNMFGRFVYASEEPMNPNFLKETIVESMSEYMNVIDSNIVLIENRRWEPIHRDPDNSSEIDTENPPKGLILHIMNTLNCDQATAINFLNRTEVTTRAYVAIEYSEGTDALKPVVFLSELEKDNLKKSLRGVLIKNKMSKNDKKKLFQDKLVAVCKTILGDKISESTIKGYTLNEVWQVILGVEFNGHKDLKNIKLRRIVDDVPHELISKLLTDFQDKASDFVETDYQRSNRFDSRRFLLNGVYFYWIPLEDLPGTKEF